MSEICEQDYFEFTVEFEGLRPVDRSVKILNQEGKVGTFGFFLLSENSDLGGLLEKNFLVECENQSDFLLVRAVRKERDRLLMNSLVCYFQISVAREKVAVPARRGLDSEQNSRASRILKKSLNSAISCDLLKEIFEFLRWADECMNKNPQVNLAECLFESEEEWARFLARVAQQSLPQSIVQILYRIHTSFTRERSVISLLSFISDLLPASFSPFLRHLLQTVEVDSECVKLLLAAIKFKKLSCNELVALIGNRRGFLFEFCWYFQNDSSILRQLVCRDVVDAFDRQLEFIRLVIDAIRQSKELKETRDRKRQVVIEKISNISAGPFPHPFHLHSTVVGVNFGTIYFFKSCQLPLFLEFECSPPVSHSAVIFKVGDDLQMDFLVIRLINFIDRLWKRHQLDMEIETFQIRIASSDSGCIEFIPSHSISSILKSFPDGISGYLKCLADQFLTGSLEEAQERFMKSLAGYSVITFVLGIGDRHLENILLSSKGRLFHIDFSYCFGAEPKPFAPRIKICKEMLDAIGTVESKCYSRFISFACAGYQLLRENFSFLLNCIYLLTGGCETPAVPSTVHDICSFLNKQLKPDLTEFEATKFLLKEIEESTSGVMPSVLDTLHDLVQQLRS